MSRSPQQGKPAVPTSNYVSHYDPSKSHHRAWLQAVLDLLVHHEPEALAEGSELRDLWKAAVETNAPQAWPDKPATTTEIPAAVVVALPLVKEFEGCKLTAYPDPETGGEPWTIGWGSTVYGDGATVKKGDRISQELADALLAGRLERDHRLLAQRIPRWVELSTNQQAALLSFTYNCGPAWFGSKGFTTITKVLQAGELEKVPAALMLYVNPGGPSEAGLRRRRKAEAALWSASPSRVNSKPPAGGGAIRHPNPLVGVPRYSQRDSAQVTQRDRTCFSSSCAMLLEAIKPGTLQGANGDDQYLAVVQHLGVVDGEQRTSGDTTDANAQIQALAHFGVTARLVQNADFQLIEQQIARGIPVPCGYIHRGPVDRPTGSGHWLIVYGHTPTQVVVNDPWGEPDLISGTTLNANGMGLRFSRINFGKRWMVEPIGGGAYRYAPGKGWAVVVDSFR